MFPITIQLFEHQSLTYAEAGLYPADSVRRERILAEFERLNELAGQEILHLGRKELRANALVGVLCAGDVSVEILPKIDWVPPGTASTGAHAGQETIYSAAHNLLTMLSY